MNEQRLLEGSQISPFRPPDKSRVEVKKAESLLEAA
jgi:hypothetical protein